MDRNAYLRAIPKVDEVLDAALRDSVCGQTPRTLVLEAVRDALQAVRAAALEGKGDPIPSIDAIAADVRARVEAQMAPHLCRVINATGIVLHTNLGRAPLGMEQMNGLAEAMGGYSTLEYDLATGERGSRHSHVEGLLTKLTGAEAGMAVNNNAAAVLLMLSALTRGKDVIISRGELVEIGGQFRVPDILRESGSHLIEVGTTNKTRLSDYETAIDPERCGAILKVHTSNFKIVGFSEEVGVAELSRLAKARGIPLLYDLGSGALGHLPDLLPFDEPTACEGLAAGADVVCFSGDKLLGGPQAGIAVGRKAPIEAMKRHPLARAVRIDKLTLAVLETTLRAYRDPVTARQIPVLEMLNASEGELEERAQALLAAIVERHPKLDACVLPSEGQVGGGSVPGQTIPSRAVAIRPDGLSLDAFDARMRGGPCPVVGCIHKDRYWLDVRTIPPAMIDCVAQACSRVLEEV